MRYLLALFIFVLAAPLYGQATPSISTKSSDDVSLREYIDIRLNALEAKQDASDKARQEAIVLALSSIHERLAVMNEFRAQLKDQAGTFVTKDELAIQNRGVDTRLKIMEDRFTSMDGSLKVLAVVFVIAQIALGVWLQWMVGAKHRQQMEKKT